MKKKLRTELLNLRNNLSKDEINLKSKKIFENILKSKIINDKKNIMVYMDFRNEVKTNELINYLVKNRYNVILPKVNFEEKKLDLFKIKSTNDLTLSKYGILEPNENNCESVSPNILNLIFAPGVGFDKNFFRIGYGGGYYDKLLPLTKNCIICALSFDIQIVKEIPRQNHDIKMDMIITESLILK